MSSNTLPLLLQSYDSYFAVDGPGTSKAGPDLRAAQLQLPHVLARRDAPLALQTVISASPTEAALRFAALVTGIVDIDKPRNGGYQQEYNAIYYLSMQMVGTLARSMEPAQRCKLLTEHWDEFTGCRGVAHFVMQTLFDNVASIPDADGRRKAIRAGHEIRRVNNIIGLS